MSKKKLDVKSIRRKALLAVYCLLGLFVILVISVNIYNAYFWDPQSMDGRKSSSHFMEYQKGLMEKGEIR